MLMSNGAASQPYKGDAQLYDEMAALHQPTEIKACIIPMATGLAGWMADAGQCSRNRSACWDHLVAVPIGPGNPWDRGMR